MGQDAPVEGGRCEALQEAQEQMGRWPEGAQDRWPDRCSAEERKKTMTLVNCSLNYNMQSDE